VFKVPRLVQSKCTVTAYAKKELWFKFHYSRVKY